MSILVNGGPATEALAYDHVHMDVLTIIQDAQVVNATMPLYQLRVKYRLYAVDSFGNRQYEARTRQINVEDYLSLAAIKASEGNPELLNAMQAVETALGLVIQTLGDVGQVI